jgi:hypothetical protein
MSEVAYLSLVRIERVKGPLRLAYLPAEKEPVLFGVYGAGRNSIDTRVHGEVPANTGLRDNSAYILQS